MLKIATWNVNSIRARISRIKDFLLRHDVDILCVQEIKATKEQVPYEDIDSIGYNISINPQKTYNGVAIFTKKPHLLADVSLDMGFAKGSKEARFIKGQFGSLTLINVYVPNGKDVSDPAYEYKLKWYEAFTLYLKENINQKTILLGDFNVAPYDQDCFDSHLLMESLSVSAREREAYQKMMAVGFVDTFTHLHGKKQAFTFWDYRFLSFQKDMGFRIDHILCSKALLEHLKEVQVDRDERKPQGQKAQKPSDHAPVIATFDL